MELSVRTHKRVELIDISRDVQDAINEAGVKDGFVIVFAPHTTAAITINENADPSVPRDILNKLNEVIPFDDKYEHMEGNSDAHIKSSLIGCSEQIIIENGKLKLGTWQGIFFCEFDGPRNRKVFIKIIS